MTNCGLYYNGKPFNGDEFHRDMEKALSENAHEQIQERLQGLVCPHHGQTPQLEEGFNVLTGGGKVSFCCETLQEMFQKEWA